MKEVRLTYKKFKGNSQLRLKRAFFGEKKVVRKIVILKKIMFNDNFFALSIIIPF